MCSPLLPCRLWAASCQPRLRLPGRLLASVEHSVQRTPSRSCLLRKTNPRAGSLLLGGAARQALSAVHNLQNAVTQLLAEDELCVLRHKHEDLVEFESPAGAGVNDSAGTQQADEVRKHRSVEELR